jgi:hypothetical protein
MVGVGDDGASLAAWRLPLAQPANASTTATVPASSVNPVVRRIFLYLDIILFPMQNYDVAKSLRPSLNGVSDLHTNFAASQYLLSLTKRLIAI